MQVIKMQKQKRARKLLVFDYLVRVLVQKIFELYR